MATRLTSLAAAPTLSGVVIPAPAKINLHLRIGPPRVDGFHPLLTWMCTIGLQDRLHIEIKSAPGIELTCSDPTLPTDDGNLVHRAATAVIDPARQGVKIHLRKSIPHGAGLGGGSSDAAATLQAVGALFNKSTNLHDLAARLGSDVPFFLHAPSAICSGRGEIVRSISPPMARWAGLFLPNLSMPTPAVYRRFDEMKLGHADAIKDVVDWESWATSKSEALLPKLVNDLEPPAFSLEPKLGNLRQQIEQTLARIVRMSGSGSSLFTLYDDEPTARQSVQLIQDRLHVRALACAMGSF